MPITTTRTIVRMLAGCALVMAWGCGSGLHTRGLVVDARKDGGGLPTDAENWPDLPKPPDDAMAQCPPTSEVPDQPVSKVMTIEGGILQNCEAILVVDKFILAPDTETKVTLRRLASDGVLQGQTSQALGPVFSITTETERFPQPVKLGMRFKPFVDVPNERLRFAYYQLISRQWIKFEKSGFDPVVGMLTGEVDNMGWDIIEIAPFAACSSSADCVPPLPPNCSRGDLCQ